jgi:hypothetical protein
MQMSELWLFLRIKSKQKFNICMKLDRIRTYIFSIFSHRCYRGSFFFEVNTPKGNSLWRSLSKNLNTRSGFRLPSALTAHALGFPLSALYTNAPPMHRGAQSGSRSKGCRSVRSSARGRRRRSASIASFICVARPRFFNILHLSICSYGKN